MRPLLPGDLDQAARAMLAVPEPRRGALARRLVAEARAADRYRRRCGLAHPRWGDGSLMAAAMRHPQLPLGPVIDAAQLAALRQLLGALDGGGRL